MSAYSAAVLADSPVNYWSLKDTSDAGSAPATLTGAGSITVGGASGLFSGSDAATLFDGTDDSLSAGDINDFANTASFSVECWAAPTSTNFFRYMVTKFGKDGGNNNEGWRLHFDVGRKVHFGRALAGLEDAIVGSTSVQTTDTVHIVATYDGTNLRLYVNGVSDATPVASATLLPNTTHPNIIGTRDGSNANTYKGVLDEVAIYSTALSAAQVLSHYQAGLSHPHLDNGASIYYFGG